MTIDSTKPPVLILGLSATGLAVSRIFASRGVKVYGVDRDKNSIGRYSKYIHKTDFGYIAKMDSLLNDIIKFAKKIDIKLCLIPTDDEFIEFISKNRDNLIDYFFVSSSFNCSCVNDFLNKKNFYKVCEKYNINVPKSIYCNGDEDICEIMREIRYPFIIKPDLIHHWKKQLHGAKVLYINSEFDFTKALMQYQGILKQSTIQEIIPGPESNIFLFKGYFSEKNGECMADFTGQKIRQVPIGFGSGSFVKSIENKAVKEISIEFLKAYGFRGLCGSEFKYDERDQKYKMIEVNLRPQLWEDLTRVAKRDVLWYAYSDMIGMNADKIPDQRNEVYWSYFLRDLTALPDYIINKRGSIIDLIKCYLKLSTDAVLSYKDPVVSIMAPYITLLQVISYYKGK